MKLNARFCVSQKDFENAVFAYVLGDGHQYCKKSKPQEYDKILCRRWNEPGVKCFAGFQVIKRRQDEGPGWRLTSAQSHHSPMCTVASYIPSVLPAMHPLPTPPSSNDLSPASPVPTEVDAYSCGVSRRSFGGKKKVGQLAVEVPASLAPDTIHRASSVATDISELSVYNSLVIKKEDVDVELPALSALAPSASSAQDEAKINLSTSLVGKRNEQVPLQASALCGPLNHTEPSVSLEHLFDYPVPAANRPPLRPPMQQTLVRDISLQSCAQSSLQPTPTHDTGPPIVVSAALYRLSCV